MLEEELELALKNGDLSPSEFIEIYFTQDKLNQGVYDSGFYKNIKKREIGFPDYHFYPTYSPETTPQEIKVDRARFGARPRDLAKRLEPIEKKYGMRLIYERY